MPIFHNRGSFLNIGHVPVVGVEGFGKEVADWLSKEFCFLIPKKPARRWIDQGDVATEIAHDQAGNRRLQDAAEVSSGLGSPFQFFAKYVQFAGDGVQGLARLRISARSASDQLR